MKVEIELSERQFAKLIVDDLKESYECSDEDETREALLRVIKHYTTPGDYYSYVAELTYKGKMIE